MSSRVNNHFDKKWITKNFPGWGNCLPGAAIRTRLLWGSEKDANFNLAAAACRI
jgi:hypothetical protein